MIPRLWGRIAAAIFAVGTSALFSGGAGSVDSRPLAQAPPQAPAWDVGAREEFYHLDQGSRLIPSAWLRALRTRDGRDFGWDRFARYGFLADPIRPDALPIGFSTAQTPDGTVVGMTCAACHTRQITVGDERRLIDGAPAFIDFQSFVTDLDRSVLDVLADETRFATFGRDVLGERAAERAQVASLREAVRHWSRRFHALVAGSMESAHPWGPARLDAMQLIFNQLAGLDVGPPPDHLLTENMALGTAPVRYPFLWNAAVQDHVQWGGFSKNGSDVLALTRNLGQLYGVFGAFVPQPPSGGTNAPRDYLASNSANMVALLRAEALIKGLKPPIWPWPLDPARVKAGAEIFARPPERGGCVACHGERDGAVRTPGVGNWRTPRLDVGTDTSVWDHVLLRTVATGSMEGASVSGYFPALKPTDSALSLLEVSVLGSIFQFQAKASQPADMMKDMPKDGPTDMPRRDMVETPPEDPSDAFKAHVYEARVLHGVWAAAPYLHNGSVPTLADLLTPAAQRPARFRIGPAYDPAKVGLSATQGPGTFELTTTGCASRGSGVSRCGHEFGTGLLPAEKTALIEYLKAL